MHAQPPDLNDTPRPPVWLRRPDVWLATGLGFGLSPFAPGTVGTLWGVLLALALKRLPGAAWEVAAVALLCLAAVPLCGSAERFFAKKDDRRIVADEYVTFPLCIIGLPAVWWVLVVAFLTHRACDIFKPPPAARLQELPGGWGIVVDDVIASLYSLGINWAVYWLATRLGHLG
ncbi:MAG: phosphatidylglycerophosphatase A [Kiritimatiellae bacterium]|nr:phosphatidylglycerophosphatase A [Kiritimatiellia bacterium]